MVADLPADDRIVWLALDDQARAQLESAVRKALSGRSWIGAAYIYGSLARPGSTGRDIDIGLSALFLPGDGLQLDAICEELSALTGIDADRFDVRILDGANPVLLGEVLTGGKCLYEASPDDRVRFEAHALSVWLDYKPVWERMRREMLERSSGG